MSMSGRTRTVFLAFLGSMLALPLVVHSQPQRQPVDTAGHVAVAVFTNVTGEQADAWIGFGIAESVAIDLGGSVESADGRARWRVVGAYQRVGDNLRITAELVDVPTGRTLNALKLDGQVSDLFGLQDELSRQLTALLRQHEASSAPMSADRERPRSLGEGSSLLLPIQPVNATVSASISAGVR